MTRIDSLSCSLLTRFRHPRRYSPCASLPLTCATVLRRSSGCEGSSDHGPDASPSPCESGMRASAKSSANGKNSFKVRSSRSCSRRTAGTRTRQGLQEVLDRGVQAPHDLVGTAAIQAVLLAIGLAICGVPGAAMLGFVALLPAIGQIGAPLLVLIWGGAAWWLFAQEQQIWGHVHNLPHRDGRFVGSAKRWAFVLALAATGIASISLARADEAQAKNLLKAMSDYFAAQKAISFDYIRTSKSSARSSRKSGWQVPAL